jgi:hypothetical protein
MRFLFSKNKIKQEKERGKDRDTVLLNESAVLSEIVRMGEGLILG